MNWYSIFYLFSVADRVGTLLGWAVFIFSVTAIIGVIVALVYHLNGDLQKDEEGKKYSRRWVMWALTVWFIVCLTYVAIPSRKDMLLIVAGGAVGEFVVNDPNAKQIPADIAQFLRKEILEATLEEGLVSPALDTLQNKSKDELLKIVQELQKQKQ
jgi:hypothetical protein